MHRSAVVGLGLATLIGLSACGSDGFEPAVEVIITSITPDVLAPGTVATIEGSGFSPTPSENTVTVAGRPVTVLSASETTLEIQLPTSGFPCASAEGAEVVVQVGGRSGSTLHPIEGGAEHALAVGELLLLEDGGGCTVLTEPGRYLVSVFNGSTSRLATTSFSLVGAGTAAAELAADVLRYTVSAGSRAGERSWPAGARHGDALRRSLELVERLGAPRHPERAPTAALRTLPVGPPVGTVRSFRIPDLDATSPCTTYLSVTARAVYSGTRGVVWEDQASPLANQMDATWTAVGQEFDDVMYPIILEYFGDPLVYDDQLDNDERLHMLFSPEVNGLERDLAGFVYSGDLFPRSGPNSCAASDTTEIFYGIVPTSGAAGFEDPADEDAITRDRWHWTMRSTVIHEVKHITSFAHRFANNAVTYEDEWLEEATARAAEELYARAVYGYGQDGNVGYQESVFCEVRPTGFAECPGARPYVMAKHFLGLHDYYASVETLTPIGRVDDSDNTFYGSGWLLLRWAMDQASLTEQEFLKALTSATSLAGIDNLVARTGIAYPELLAYFSLSLAMDDRPGLGFTPDPKLVLPGWNVRNVFAGIADDFPDDFPEPFPLQVRPLTFGSFDVTVPTVRGGSASLFELSGFTQGDQSLSLESTSGGAAPAGLGLAIGRVE